MPLVLDPGYNLSVYPRAPGGAAVEVIWEWSGLLFVSETQPHCSGLEVSLQLPSVAAAVNME